jgi:hypothetical protein
MGNGAQIIGVELTTKQEGNYMAEFTAGGMSVEKWLENLGRKGRATGCRWIRQGLIKPVNILGQNFITREEDERFWVRAKAGEFVGEDRGIIQHQKEKRSKS